jgi:cytochrome c556
MLGSLAINSIAFAHGVEKHGKTVTADVQMEKLHAMMPMFSVTSAKLETALEKGDAAEAAVEAGKIIAAVPDLEKSKPHKNAKHRKLFVEQARKLGTAATTIVTLAKSGDFSGAKTAFKKVEEACAECHAKFRD